jgi:23S rRNA (pseudouridine1915-N3)-methyltransferase
MKIALLQVGKTAERYLTEGTGVFEGRIRKYAAFEIFTIPDIRNTRNMSATELKAREGERILQFLKNDDYIAILDDKGKEFSTIEFSSWIEKTLLLQKKRLVFVIGGVWGFSDEVYDRADLRISLSRLTFSHQMVRLLFLEQLYRAFTIIKGEPYHHD